MSLHFDAGPRRPAGLVGVAIAGVVGPIRGGSGGRGTLMHPGCPIGCVYLCTQPVDFRKQINGLAAIVEQDLDRPLFSDTLFVLINRRRDKIKALYWHRNGFYLWQKQLEKRRFAWPKVAGGQTTCTLNIKELEWLIEGFDLWRNKLHETLHYQATC